jgi:hypothetical protein
MPRVYYTLLIREPSMKGGAGSDALGMVLHSTGMSPWAPIFLIPREASASKFTHMAGRAFPREPHLTARARVLPVPVPDAIVQSDWQWQLTPSCPGEASNKCNEGSRASKKG